MPNAKPRWECHLPATGPCDFERPHQSNDCRWYLHAYIPDEEQEALTLQAKANRAYFDRQSRAGHRERMNAIEGVKSVEEKRRIMDEVRESQHSLEMRRQRLLGFYKQEL